MQRPLVMLTLAFITGILLANFLKMGVGFLLFITLGAAILALVAHLNHWREAALILLVIAVLLGALRTELLNTGNVSRLTDDLHTHLTLSGPVISEPKLYPNRTVYEILAQKAWQPRWSESLNEKVQVTVFSSDKLPYAYGDIIQVRGQLDLPPTQRNPGEFDYRAYLARQGVFTTMAVEKKDLVKTGEVSGVYHTWMRFVLSAKSKVVKLMDKALPLDQAGLLQAVLFGSKEKLDDQQKETFRDLGVFHVFAVSGLHVGFILLFLLVISSLLQIPKFGTALLTGAGLFFYASVTGFSPSVTRAGIMAGTILLAGLVNRERDFYTSLALAAAIILWINPLTLFDTGFQLSFLAAFGIVYLFPFFDELLGTWPRWRSYLIVPLAAQTFLLPVIAYNFNLVSPVGVLVNIPVVAATGVVVTLGLVTFLLTFMFPFAGEMTAYAAGALLHLTENFLEIIVGIPGAVFTVRTPDASTIIVFYLFLFLIRESWMHRGSSFWKKLWEQHRAHLIVCFIFVTSVFILIQGNFLSRPSLEITFLDVGQGSAVFIKTPSGKTILVDGGGNLFSAWDPGEKILLPFLRHKGIRKLDVVVNSHPDADHLEGLITILKKMPVSLVLTPPATYFEGGYEQLQKILLEKEKTKWVQVQGLISIVLDSALEIVAFCPEEACLGTRADDNNNSLVLKIIHQKNSFLLSGDIEQERMQQMLVNGELLQSTVLLFPHHGSRFGLYLPFLEVVNPQAVVFQVGKNSFGHPAPEVINYWDQQGIKIFRNDRQGAVTMNSDGNLIQVQTVISD